MIINKVVPNIETSEEFHSKMFGIGDSAFIFDVLRSKMYSNPILAICREISCNAKDAHREVSKKDLPIEIALPHTLDPNLRIKDYGPGISVDRMEDIFINYGASTKRNSNIECGGYGLGSKTPFSYTDTFTIETIHNSIKYSYVCFIDETKVGKLSLLSKEVTDLPNGTTIVIPVKSKDFYLFKENIEFATRHWPIKPIIHGDKIQYYTYSEVFAGPNWKVIKSDNYPSYKCIKLIVDGIEYPLDWNVLPDTRNFHIEGTVFLYFNTGDLALAANRESVHLDEATIKLLTQKLKEIEKTYISSIRDKVESQPDLFEAILYVKNELYNVVYNYRTLLTNLTWKNIPILNICNSYGTLQLKDLSVINFQNDYRRKKGVHFYPAKPSIEVNSGAKYYLDDLKSDHFDPKHFATLTKNLHNCIITLPPEKKKDLSLQEYNDLLNQLLDENHIPKDKLIPLSTVLTEKKVQAPKAKLIIYKYNQAKLQFEHVGIEVFKQDTNAKVLASLKRSEYYRTISVVTSKNNLSSQVLSDFIKNNPNVSFYGVDQKTSSTKITKTLGDLQALEGFFDQQLKSITNFRKIKFLQINGHDCFNDYYWKEKLSDNIKNKITDKDSLYLKFITLCQSNQKLLEKEEKNLKLYEEIYGYITLTNTDEKEFADLNTNVLKNKILKVYPLLGETTYISTRNLYNAVAQYINLIDKELKENEKSRLDANG